MGVHFIGLDVHCGFTEMAVVNGAGRVIRRERCATAIPELVAAIESVRRPRRLTFEEGPMADWLRRHLLEYVDELVVCEPRRNHLIAKDSDKDDPLDAEKIAQLYRGGFLKAVHHADRLERMIFKQHVNLYHARVRQRVREANHILAQLRRHGVFVKEAAFASPEDRAGLLKRLPKQAMLREDLEVLWQGYDVVAGQVDQMRKSLIRWARREAVIRRFAEVPGIHWVRAATFYAYLDTPWRFRSKSALWRYCGVGLERSHSGSGPCKVRVSQNVNHVLRNLLLGAAQTVIRTGNTPFFSRYRDWLEEGLSFRNARRNLARSLAATLWGMWKSNSAYRPKEVTGSGKAEDASVSSR